jgi:DNA sulfur modification protein DndC
LYKSASGNECPVVIDESTPSCGSSRFGCWTCTVVDRDKSSEGLLASGDSRMQALLNFREILLKVRDPENGYRDTYRKNGQEGAGPLTMEGRKLLLEKLLRLQQDMIMSIVTEEELHWIQLFWKSARCPDDGTGVAGLIFQQKGGSMPTLPDAQLSIIKKEVADEKGISIEILTRLIEKIEEYSESQRAQGLSNELRQILQDALNQNQMEK